MGWLTTRFLEWAAQSSLAKGGAAITIGITVGVLSSYATTEVKIQNAVSAQTGYTDSQIKELRAYMQGRRELRDEQYNSLSHRLSGVEAQGVYLRGAVDETNRNVLKLYDKIDAFVNSKKK